MGERLRGKVALVTGSTSGIGRATAELFAAEGARVVVTGRRRELGEEVAAAIQSVGGEANFVAADFTSSAAARETVQFTLRAYGRIDVLVNNAMSHALPWAGDGRETLKMTEDEWGRMLQVGLTASLVTCQEAIPAMIRQGGGSIVTMGSIRSFLVRGRGLAYDVVKAGLLNLSRQLNVAFGRHGIRSNIVCPGWIVTDPAYAEQVISDPLLRPKVEVLQTVQRPGQPNDIAEAALYFASDAASFVAGAMLVVDGGLSISTHHESQTALEDYYRRLFRERPDLLEQ